MMQYEGLYVVMQSSFLKALYSIRLLVIISRQTSDPRSGFATVEKDFPGGLTPMLGDRKVSAINNPAFFFCWFTN